MVNDKQPFYLRCAVLYCFQCFLYRNELGQAQIVQTLLPSTTDSMYLDFSKTVLCFSCIFKFEYLDTFKIV